MHEQLYVKVIVGVRFQPFVGSKGVLVRIGGDVARAGSLADSDQFNATENVCVFVEVAAVKN
jgi:hypothetical protein